MTKQTMKWKLFSQTMVAFLMTLLLTGFASTGNAQITIGVGSGDDRPPFSVDRGFSRDATIYTASEMNTLTTGATITTLEWEAQNNGALAPVKIYLKAVGTATQVVSDTWANTIAGATEVYNATPPDAQTGNWLFIDITDFPIAAGQNLEVLVETNTGGSGHSPFAVAVPNFSYTPAAQNTHGYILTDNTAPTTQTMTINNKRPDIRIGGLTPPSCSPPAALSASGITGTTANVNMTASASAPASYGYYLSTVNTAPGTATTATGNVTGTTINLTGLAYSTTYYIWARSNCSSTDTSNWSNYITFTTVQSPPANDECANATMLTVNSDLDCDTTLVANTIGATQSAQPAGGAAHPTGINDDIWYEFTATNTTHQISLTNVSGSYGMVMALYSGSCNALNYIQSATADYYEIMEATGLVIGNVYKLRIYTQFSSPGVYASYSLCVGTTPPPPSNDSCVNAITLTMNTTSACTNTTTGTTAFATHSNETPPSSQNSPGTDDDVWYQFTATDTLHRIILSDYTAFSGMVMVVYSGACGSLINVQEGNSSGQSTITMDVPGLTVNTSYKVRVFTYVSSGQGTNFNICVGPPPPPPANDECANAVELTANASTYCNSTQSGTTISATQSNETTSSLQNGPGTDDDVWYKFTATSTAHRISLSDIAPATDMEMAVYSGACGNLTFMATSFGTFMDVTGLTPGVEYKVRVYTFNSSGFANFTICLGPMPPAKDEASGAINLMVNAGCTGSPYDNTNASQSSGEPYPSCSNGTFGPEDGFTSMWYKFTAPQSGMVKVSCDGSGTMGASKMALFNVADPDDYNTFTILACDKQNGVFTPNRSLFYAAGLTPNNIYYISVDCKASSSGFYQRGTYCVTVDSMDASMLDTTSGSCTAGQGMTLINPDYHGWLSLVSNSGKLIANIRNVSGNAKTFNVSSRIKTGSPRTDFDGTPYLNRNYMISASQGTATSTDVQFFFTDAELANLGSAIGSLNVTKVPGNTCTDDFVDASGKVALLQAASGHPVSGVNYVQVNTPGFSNFFIMPGTAPLPLDLVSFSGRSKGGANLLDWKTANEKGFSHFELQRSGDGKAFSKLDKIPAKNNYGGDYHYTDAQPLNGKNFYRLSMVDANGNASVSTIIELNAGRGNNASVSLYPNPVSKALKIVVEGDMDADATVQITDIIGKVVKTIRMRSNVTEIDMSDLSNGTYIIKYNSNKGSFTGKVIKN